MFRYACKMGLEGIVSKRKRSAYRSDSPDWLKMKNANASTVKREEEEDWGTEPSQVRDHWAPARGRAIPRPLLVSRSGCC